MIDFGMQNSEKNQTFFAIQAGDPGLPKEWKAKVLDAGKVFVEQETSCCLV